MSNTIKATLQLAVIHPTDGASTKKAGILTFDRDEMDELIPLVRKAAAREEARGLKVTGFSLIGKRVRHAVDATYSSGGTWADHRDGICPAEAGLHGAMAMAIEEGTRDTFMDRLEAAEFIEIDHCVPEPVTGEEYRDALLSLVKEVRAAGHEGPSLDAVVRLLSLDGVEVEEGPAPRM
jgi:hypothetical protein